MSHKTLKIFLALFLSFNLFINTESVAELEELPSHTSPAPHFGENNPPAKGIILAFKNWPLTSEKSKAILKQAESLNLSKIAEYALFKSIVFEWADWKGANEAIQACESFASFSQILDFCEPDFFLTPATGWLKSRTKRKVRRDKERKGRSSTNEPPSKIKLNPPPLSSGSGNIVSCNIVPTQLKLQGGALSDYWAQELVGADLVKERLKKAPKMKKHLVAVFDSTYSGRHDLGVKNLISAKGRQATLPDIGKSMTLYDTYISSWNMDHSSSLHRQANNKCAGKKPK